MMYLLLHVTRAGSMRACWRSGVKDNQVKLWETAADEYRTGFAARVRASRKEQDMFIQINSSLSVARHVTYSECLMDILRKLLSKYPHWVR